MNGRQAVKKKTKPRLQPRTLARSVSLSALPADLRRYDAWLKKKGHKTRSAGFRALLDEVGA